MRYLRQELRAALGALLNLLNFRKAGTEHMEEAPGQGPAEERRPNNNTDAEAQRIQRPHDDVTVSRYRAHEQRQHHHTNGRKVDQKARQAPDAKHRPVLSCGSCGLLGLLQSEVQGDSAEIG
eukprot:s3443_g9.t1